MFSTNILQPSTYLKLGAFINDIKYKLTINIYNVNNNIVVKINVIL